jgi:hypothetical protein
VLNAEPIPEPLRVRLHVLVDPFLGFGGERAEDENRAFVADENVRTFRLRTFAGWRFLFGGCHGSSFLVSQL